MRRDVWTGSSDNITGPFGGMKMTGGGRELRYERLDEYCEVKHIHWELVRMLKA